MRLPFVENTEELVRLKLPSPSKPFPRHDLRHILPIYEDIGERPPIDIVTVRNDADLALVQKLLEPEGCFEAARFRSFRGVVATDANAVGTVAKRVSIDCANQLPFDAVSRLLLLQLVVGEQAEVIAT